MAKPSLISKIDAHRIEPEQFDVMLKLNSDQARLLYAVTGCNITIPQAMYGSSLKTEYHDVVALLHNLQVALCSVLTHKL